MHMKELTTDIFVAAQLSTQDISAAAAQGIKSIINNRPDGEEPGQPTSADLASAASELGMQYIGIPVVPGMLTEEKVAEFGAACNELPGPMLVFCRTGTRSTALWCLNSARTLQADAVLAIASAAGYDLSALRERLLSRSD